jgi:hypothetical protein
MAWAGLAASSTLRQTATNTTRRKQEQILAPLVHVTFGAAVLLISTLLLLYGRERAFTVAPPGVLVALVAYSLSE